LKTKNGRKLANKIILSKKLKIYKYTETSPLFYGTQAGVFVREGEVYDSSVEERYTLWPSRVKGRRLSPAPNTPADPQLVGHMLCLGN